MSNFGDSSSGPRALSGLSFEIALITTLSSYGKNGMWMCLLEVKTKKNEI